MNERIKELAIEAGYSKDFIEIGLPGNQLKFAELIVRQCLFEMMHECVTNPASSIPIQDFMTVVAQRIQTRFGVE